MAGHGLRVCDELAVVQPLQPGQILGANGLGRVISRTRVSCPEWPDGPLL